MHLQRRAIALLLVGALAGPAHAQADDPINVTPLGPVMTPGDLARQAVYDTPSPAPGALPGAFRAGLLGMAYDQLVVLDNGGPASPVVVEITLDSSRNLYAYDCDQGRCQGFALDVWEGLSQDQQQSYLTDIGTHLQEAVPDHRKYWVEISGSRMEGKPPHWNSVSLALTVNNGVASFGSGYVGDLFSP